MDEAGHPWGVSIRRGAAAGKWGRRRAARTHMPPYGRRKAQVAPRDPEQAVQHLFLHIQMSLIGYRLGACVSSVVCERHAAFFYALHRLGCARFGYLLVTNPAIGLIAMSSSAARWCPPAALAAPIPLGPANALAGDALADLAAPHRTGRRAGDVRWTGWRLDRL